MRPTIPKRHSRRQRWMALLDILVVLIVITTMLIFLSNR